MSHEQTTHPRRLRAIVHGCALALAAVAMWAGSPAHAHDAAQGSHDHHADPGLAPHDPLQHAHPRRCGERCRRDLAVVKRATRRYRDPANALADGYVPGPCVQTADGMMGEHWSRLDRMADRRVDPREPEQLLYAPRPSGRRLVAVEWSAPALADGAYHWGEQAPARVAAPPRLFGHAFDGPMHGHTPLQPWHHDLHVWIWGKNPRGTFARYNAALRCAAAPPAAARAIAVDVHAGAVETGSPARITVAARDAATGAPLSGVTVRAGAAEARTGARGRAALAVRSEHAGPLPVVAHARGYAPGVTAVTVAAPARGSFRGVLGTRRSGGPTGYAATIEAAPATVGVLRRMEFELAPGFRIDTRIPAQCHATDAQLRAQGERACPRPSRVGHGGVDLRVLGAPDGTPPRRLRLALFNTRGGQIVMVTDTATQAVAGIARVAIRGRVFRVDLPTCLAGGQPPRCAADEVALVRYHERLYRIVRDGRAYRTAPPRCPASGHWTNRATFTYSTGAVQRHESRSPCTPDRRR